MGRRHKGKVAEWSVVNEAFTRKQHLYGLSDWLADKIGDQSYIDKSSIWARQADPESKVCPGFSTLSITDKETWYNYLPGTPNSNPLPFDRNYKPKPAYYSLREALVK